jgi:hypothetical protein
MVITQAIGADAARGVTPSLAKEEVRKIKNRNQAIKETVKVKVAASTLSTLPKKREEAITETMKENPAFDDAVTAKLFQMLLDNI